MHNSKGNNNWRHCFRPACPMGPHAKKPDQQFIQFYLRNKSNNDIGYHGVSRVCGPVQAHVVYKDESAGDAFRKALVSDVRMKLRQADFARFDVQFSYPTLRLTSHLSLAYCEFPVFLNQFILGDSRHFSRFIIVKQTENTSEEQPY